TARFGIFESAPRTTIDRFRPKFTLRERIAPVAKSSFGELHDVALVHQCHRLAIVVDGVLDRLAHQPLGSLARHGFDPDARGCREADLAHAHLLDQKFDELLGGIGFGGPLDARVDVLRVLAEDHHVGLVGFLHRARDAFKIANRPQAYIQIELLPKRDVERTYSATDRCRQWTLDRDDVFLEDGGRLFGQPHISAVHLGRFFAGVDLHPLDLAPASISLGNSSVDHLDHHGRDIHTRAVAFDIRNDGTIGNVEAKVFIDGYPLALGWDLDVLIRGHGFSLADGVVERNC